MNLLFEIPDIVLIAAGLIIVLIIAIIAIVIKVTNRKVKPISDDERYDSEEIEVEEVTKKELTNEQKEAKEELQRVFSQMSEDLEKQKNAKDEVEMFEEEQEENAIISYQELMAQAEKLKKEADKYERLAEVKADTKVKEATLTYERHEAKPEVRKKRIEKKKEAFRSSDIVSPIYGIQSNKNMVRQKKSQNPKNSDIIGGTYEKESQKEGKQNLDFLNSLKEFRKNL